MYIKYSYRFYFYFHFLTALTNLCPPWSKYRPGSCPWRLRTPIPLLCRSLILMCHRAFSQENSFITKILCTNFFLPQNFSLTKLIPLLCLSLCNHSACKEFPASQFTRHYLPHKSGEMWLYHRVEACPRDFKRKQFCNQENCLHYMSVKMQHIDRTAEILRKAQTFLEPLCPKMLWGATFKECSMTSDRLESFTTLFYTSVKQEMEISGTC